ncbi:MAG: DMT family transporter [Gemmatimonadota bacterium]
MTARLQQRSLGYAEALLAAVLWASSGIFSVRLFALGVPPESLALLRPALGVGLLALAVTAVHGTRGLRVSGHHAVILLLGGGSVVGLFQLAYQMSTDAVGVPSTVALVYLAPPLVVAASGPLLGEWPTPRRIVLAVVTLLGVWMTVLGADLVAPTFGGTGVIWGVLAGMSYAGYTLFGRYATPRFGSGATVLYSTIGACAWLAASMMFLVDEFVFPSSWRAWGLLAIFALVTLAAAQFLFFDALGRIEASRASITSAAEPVVAAMLATILLSQGLAPLGWAGVGLVVIGVVGVGADRSTTPPAGPS